MELLRPESLFLLVLLPLVWWWHRRSIAPLRGLRKIFALGVRLAVLILLVLALSEPRWSGTTERQEVLFVVDQSRSLDKMAVDAAGEFLAGADWSKVDSAWLGFAGQSRIFSSLDDLKNADPTLLKTDETRLDTALALAAASFRPGVVKTLVVFSDGNSTGAVVDPETLAEQKIRVHVVPVNSPDVPEVLVREVRVPQRVRAGDPVRVETTIQSTREMSVEVDLFRNGVRVANRPVSVKPGATDFVFDDRAGDDKLLHYEVGVRSRSDTLAENNRSGAATLSEGPSRVLLLSDRVESGRYLAWALKQEGIELATRPAEGVPTQLSDLQNFDAVIIDNIPASSLSAEQMKLLHAYVRDFGGGLVMLGGDQAYGLGGYFRTPVEDVLPVQCDFQKDEENPTLALALVIDRSGSMSGDKMELAKAAAKASADLLTARDSVSVIAFDDQVQIPVPMQSADGPSIGSAIASITAGGGTNIAPGLEEALRQLSSSSAKLKHVILLTDGMSQEGPFYELATQMAQNGITVSSVAVGDGADSNLLAQIAQWGNGRFYETADPSTIPQIFTKETMTAAKSAIQEFPFLARPVRAVDFLEGVPWDNAPFLLGYVRTKPKPTSETWLMTESGDPLLTTWRFGLGTSAAFTSDARNRWAVEWLRWSGFGKFWAQLLRRVSRPASLGTSEIRTEWTNGRVVVTVNALDDVQTFPVDTSGRLRVVSADGKDQDVPLEKILPGRWRGEFAVEGPGISSGQVTFEKNGQPAQSAFFTHTRGYSQEFLLDPPAMESLGRLAAATGGALSPEPAAVLAADDRLAPVERELWPWLALAALLLFVVDVALRRWPD